MVSDRLFRLYKGRFLHLALIFLLLALLEANAAASKPCMETVKDHPHIGLAPWQHPNASDFDPTGTADSQNQSANILPASKRSSSVLINTVLLFSAFGTVLFGADRIRSHVLHKS